MAAISGVNAGAIRPLTAAEQAPEAPRVEQPRQQAQGRPARPAMDEYIPEEPGQPSGRYWMGKDEAGRPKVCFDDPERAAEDSPKPKTAPGPEGPEQSGEERYVGDTGKVDREIERLKKKQEQLKQRLGSETDEEKIKDLERQLAQVERELKLKDNDAYRKQHTAVTKLD